MLKLRQRGPVWYITGTLKGCRYRESTGTDSRPHAEAILAKRQSEILDRAVWGEKRTAIFAEAVELYLTHGGEARFVMPLLNRWGTWKIEAITAAEVARASRELYPGRRAATIDRQLYTPLNSILRRAAKAEMSELRIFERPRVRRNPVTYADDAWISKVLPHCNDRLAGCLLFITLTGVRASEVCRLTWDDLDLERGKALIRRTKNGKPREVPLAPVVVEAIRAITACRLGSRLVFWYTGRWSLNQAIERSCKRAKVPYLSSHKIGRHAFAARLLRAGHSLKLVQQAGAWSSIGIVAEHYGHLEQSDVDRAMTKAGTNLTHSAASTKKVVPFKRVG